MFEWFHTHHIFTVISQCKDVCLNVFRIFSSIVFNFHLPSLSPRWPYLCLLWRLVSISTITKYLSYIVFHPSLSPLWPFLFLLWSQSPQWLNIYRTWCFFSLVPPINILSTKHRKNCECCPRHSLFKGHNVIANIVVLNCQKCNQCLKCQVSGHKCLGLIFESVL